MSKAPSGQILLASLPDLLQRDLRDLGRWSRTLDDRLRPLQAIVHRGGAVIHALEEGGLRQHQIVLILAAVGIERADGTHFPEKSLSSALRREHAAPARQQTKVSPGTSRREASDGGVRKPARLQKTAESVSIPQVPADARKIPQDPAFSGTVPQSPARSVTDPHGGSFDLKHTRQQGAEAGLLALNGAAPKPTDVDLDDAADLLISQRSEGR